MISQFYLDQLPDEVLADPAATEDAIYLLVALLIYRTQYAPKTEAEVRMFMLGCKDARNWDEDYFAEVLSDLRALLGRYDEELEDLEMVIPNQAPAEA